jgi:hypothetical protein
VDRKMRFGQQNRSGDAARLAVPVGTCHFSSTIVSSGVERPADTASTGLKIRERPRCSRIRTDRQSGEGLASSSPSRSALFDLNRDLRRNPTIRDSRAVARRVSHAAQELLALPYWI